MRASPPSASRSNSPKGKISGYLARPKSRGKRPTVLVIHENRGLNPHLEDVARRFAAEGFLAYAIDLLSLVGGTPANEEEALKLHPKMNVRTTPSPRWSPPCRS